MKEAKSTIVRILYPGWTLYKSLVLEPLFRIKNSWFIWNTMNYKEKSLQHTKPLSLSACGKRVVEDLRRDGITITHIDEMFPNSSWLSDMRAHAESLKPTAIRNETKPYWLDMWDMDNFFIELSNPFVRFALQDECLSVANAYFDMYIKFYTISLAESLSVETGAAPMQSQRWHRDGGNKKYLKIFVYLNDVAKENGPFTYVKGSHPEGKWYDTFPRLSPYSPRSKRVSNEELSKVVPDSDILKCTGKAGTIVCADTSGLHKGGYVIHGSRLATIITYISHYSLVRNRNKFIYPNNIEEQAKNLSPQARYALLKKSGI